MRETPMDGTAAVYAESRPSSGVAWLAIIGGAFAAANMPRATISALWLLST
jgi:hypothetical protein